MQAILNSIKFKKILKYNYNSLMNIMLPKILNLLKDNKLDDSLKEINKISNHDKNFKLITLKGFIYFNLKEYQKSYDCYSKAINLDKNLLLVLLKGEQFLLSWENLPTQLMILKNV